MASNRTSWLVGIVVLIHQAAFSALEPTVLPVQFGQYGRAVAVGPQNTLVIWTDYRRTEDMAHEIFGARIGLLGESLDGDGIPLTGNTTSHAAVAALRNQFLIVWAQGPNVYARRMTSAGELLDVQPIVVSENPSHPYPELVYLQLTAAADGTNFWVAWTDERSIPVGTPEYQRYQYQDIYAARINRGGRVLDPRGIRICTRPGQQSAPRLSPRADFIVWNDTNPNRRCIFGARLHPKGFALDANGFGIMSCREHHLTAADVSGNRNSWLVVWGEGTQIYGAKVNKSRAVSPMFKIGIVMPLAAPQVATSGQDFLVLWQSGASTVGTRVTAAKQVGRAVTVASDPTGAAYFSFGGFAGNGARYCVTGASAPVQASWFYNDVWFGSFSPAMFP